MDVAEDSKIFAHPSDIARLTAIKHAILTKITDMDAEYVAAKEPIPFEARSNGLKRIGKGDKWGGMFDCSWFKFTAKIPESARNLPLVAVIDIAAEGLVVDGENNAKQGISNPVNIGNMADYFNLTPGKTLYHLNDVSDSVELWVEGGFNGILGKDIFCGKLRRSEVCEYHSDVADLYFDYLTLIFAKITYSGKLKAETNKALCEAYGKFRKKDIAGARAVLNTILSRPSDSDVTFTAVGHSHLDLGWLWPVRETKRKTVRTFSNALKNMDLYPDYVYGASQPQQFVWVKEKYPELYAQIKRRVEEGRLELQGGMWCECDTNVTGGESLIRQFLYGIKFWRDEFGRLVNNCWLPDVFGYSAALPQIIKKCGMDYFMTQKLSWNEHNEFPYETFVWEGISEDKVLTHLLPGNTYNSSGLAPSLIEAEGNQKRKDKQPDGLVLFGAGDGGGGPCEANIELLKRAENLIGLPRVKLGRADDFFKRLDKSRDVLPSYKGELYLEKHQGTFTTQSNNKKFNRKCEFALHDLEALASLAIRMGYDYPAEKVRKIWDELMLYQFHDILPGSSITRVYTESVQGYKKMIEVLEQEKSKVIDFLSSGDGLSALNTSPFARREYLKHDGAWYLCDAEAYSAVALQPISRTPEGLHASKDTLENDIIKVSFDGNGEIISLLHKKSRTEFNGKYLNRLSVYSDKKSFYDAWDIDINYTKKPTSRFRLISSKSFVDGARVVKENHYRYGHSTLVQKVVLYAGKPYVEFNTRVDWHETHKMLRADFIPSAFSDKVTCDIQFGNIKRSTKTDNKLDWAQFEIPAHKYVDVSDGKAGAALLSNSKYGFRVKDGLMSMNLLRSPVYPDKTADRGKHHFRYAFYPHLGDVFQAEVPKWAYNFNYAALPVSGLLQIPSLVSADKKNIVVETIKPSEDGRGTVVRAYECEGKPTVTSFTFKLSYNKVFLADMLENKGEELPKTLEFKPYEIKTLILE